MKMKATILTPDGTVLKGDIDPRRLDNVKKYPLRSTGYVGGRKFLYCKAGADITVSKGKDFQSIP